jgi:hypothetical protein
MVFWLDQSKIDAISLLYMDEMEFDASKCAGDAYEYIYDGLLQKATVRRAELFDARSWAENAVGYWQEADLVPVGMKLVEHVADTIMMEVKGGAPNSTTTTTGTVKTPKSGCGVILTWLVMPLWAGVAFVFRR